MLQFGTLSKVPSTSTHLKLQEPVYAWPRSTTSAKSTRVLEKKKSNLNTAKPQSRFFITQDEVQGDTQDELHRDKFEDNLASTQREGFNPFLKGYHMITDKRIKGILGRLDSTVDKLNKAWDSCEKTVMRSTSTSFVKPHKSSATFALTEATFEGTNHTSVLTKSTGVQNFLSMTMSDFLSPEVTAKISQVAQSLDLDPRSNQIRDYLWQKINEGRDYYNVLKDEIRKKKEKLKALKEQEEMYDFLSNNTALAERVTFLNEEIQKVEDNIEAAEMQTEVLHKMIQIRKEDKDLHQKRFTLYITPFLNVNKDLDKNVDEILTLNKIFQNYMIEMGEMKRTTNENQKLVKKIKTFQKERRQKEFNFEENIEMERVYQKKRKQFIIKTKKEMEKDKQKEKEREEHIEIKKLESLFNTKKKLEDNFGLLSTVSKQYQDKGDYVTHLENLEMNNAELEKRVQSLSEEINLKRKIDLPTLQVELEELKSSKDTTGGFSEATKLRKEVAEKHKRNEELERTVATKQGLNTNLVRGVMTIFNNISVVKDYLNLSKLDEIKLKTGNLGDVLLFCGEILEILNKNQQEHAEVKSQPLSFVSLSEDE